MNSFMTLSSTLILTLLSTNASYAAPECYIPMRSLNLSVKHDTQTVCNRKKDQVTANHQNPPNEKTAAERSHLELNGHFVRPEVENKEEATSADGLGVNLSVKF